MGSLSETRLARGAASQDQDGLAGLGGKACTAFDHLAQTLSITKFLFITVITVQSQFFRKGLPRAKFTRET